MTTPLRTTVDRLFAAVEAKDVAAVVGFFADDAVCIDPHYPTPHMAGKVAIADGLAWAFGTLEKMGFTPINYFESQDGNSAAIEMATAHRLPGGRPLNFSQTFIVEARDGRITRLQSYPPYGPNGIGGLLLGLARLQRRLMRRRATGR